MLYPEILKIGDKIGIIAPAAPISYLPSEKINKGKEYLLTKGLQVIMHEQCNLSDGYLAGSISQRVNALHDFVKDPTIKAIMTFWGGNNTNQLLEHIDYDLIKDNPKIIIGYSDFSCALLAISKFTGLVTYLGPSVISFCKPEPIDFSWEAFSSVCINNYKSVKTLEPSEFANDSYWLKDNNVRTLQKNIGIRILYDGVAEGRIIASSLASILSINGTPYLPSLSNKILFLEMGEDFSLELFDKMITQCQQSGFFKKIKGLVFSKFMEESNVIERDLISILTRVFPKNEFPIYYNFDCGHSDPILTLPIGGFCELKDGEIFLIKK